ncbi:MAG: TraB/GumN family protein [Robiginitomaculum sp.]|nr:TraB/GumN family protein [Robiginitomaculum sp.]
MTVKRIISSKLSAALLAASLSVVLLSACKPGNNVRQKVAEAHKRYDGPALWKVTDHDSTLYLFGTVHLLPDGTDWQRRDMQAAFDNVGTMFFETPDDAKSALKTSVLQRQYGLYDSGERLTDKLDIANINRLTAAAYNTDVPLARLERFKPWLVADLLSIAAADKAGLKFSNSADNYLRTQAKQAGKSIQHLDTIETYFDVVAKQPMDIQMQAFAHTIKTIDTLADDTKIVNAAWLIGDVGKLEQDLMIPAKAQSPEIYDALFTRRNIKWIETLDGFMKGDNNGMAVVGIGHLIGFDGLPTRFTDLGYKVERVQRFDLPN